ncbi:hypothetical protein VP1G_09487 [Cytospora mali]|uniref:Uncharacterized protein n=1 Tax=Cytospora mali TaxID=578113 RepID=A0A194VEZ5_CYTMA|nr:hypothetical protein VP1G_09487 [Valsa mali var. pyri (nom. inval.)]
MTPIHKAVVPRPIPTPRPIFSPWVKPSVLPPLPLVLASEVDVGIDALKTVAVASVVTATDVEVDVDIALAAPVVIGPPGRSTSASVHWLLFEPRLPVLLARRLNQQDVEVVKFKGMNIDPSYGTASCIRTVVEHLAAFGVDPVDAVLAVGGIYSGTACEDDERNGIHISHAQDTEL